MRAGGPLTLRRCSARCSARGARRKGAGLIIDTGYRTPDADPNEGTQAVLQRCAWPIPPRDPTGVRMKKPIPVGRGADVAWRGEGGLGPSSASRAVQNEPVGSGASPKH